MARRSDAEDLLFYLKMNELKSFFVFQSDREILLARARQRKSDLKLLRSVYIPHILSTSTIDTIGNPPEVNHASQSLDGQIVFKGYVSGLSLIHI